MGGLQSCIDCMGKQQGVDRDNPYYYQAFNKIPIFGSISNYLRMLKPDQGGQSQFPSIGNLIGFLPKGNPFQPQPQPHPQGIAPPPPPQSMFNISALTNLIAKGTAKASGASLFDLVGADSYVRKIKKSNYAELVKSLSEKGEKYTDNDFPPNQHSLGDMAKNGLDVSKITWKRVGDIIKEPQFVNQKIQPSDILQGELGDCYFLSALASLAQQDYRIKNIFPSLQVSPVGIYMARILHNGEYQQVVIDDYFPINAKGNALFAKPAGNREIWVMILQKCWAKLYGSYSSIVGGLPNEVLHAFSSAPTYFRPIPTIPQKQQALWREIIECDKNGALMCCGTKNDASIERQGFVKGHAYTILGAYERPYRLIKLRNPWGHKEWKGKASDEDTDFWSQVSPADKQQLDYEDSKRKKDKDGVFFIIWDDFVKYFQLIDICKINDNAHYNFIPTQFQHLTPKLFQIEVRGEQALVTFAVTQSSNRGTSRNGYSRTFLALGKLDQSTNSYRFIKSNSDKKFADNYLQIKNCTPGKYVLYTKYLWNGGVAKNTAVVSVYSTSPATIVEGTEPSSEQFLNHIFYDHAEKNPKKKVINQAGDWICSDILLNEGGFSYFVSNVNRQSTAKLGITIQQSQYTEKRLVLLSPFKGSQTSKHEVGPGNKLVVVAELLAETFPTTITNPVPTVVNLQ